MADKQNDYKSIMAKKAAALRYDPEKNGAPVIVASGMGYMAEKITEAAMKAGVPVYEDASLSTVLSQLEVGTEIPPELYQAIVEIYIYFLNFTGTGEQHSDDAGEEKEKT
jgi:flagellar biosynthesis protein